MLLVTLCGVAGLYGLLSADFLAGIQILIYVGGILILIVFAVMLTQNISEGKKSNPSRFPLVSLVIGIVFLGGMGYFIWRFPWNNGYFSFKPITTDLGNALLKEYLLPFEVISILLLVGLIGALTIARVSLGNKNKLTKDDEI